MEPLASFLPTLPWSWWEIYLNIIAIVGTIMLVYGIFLESEKKQDTIFFIGAFCLFIYAFWLGNTIFCVAMGGFAVASFIEVLEIVLGRHIHSQELIEKYKHPEK
ncbi:MAG: hypothetical protein WC457_01410 [Patescibacteria group bacterium]